MIEQIVKNEEGTIEFAKLIASQIEQGSVVLIDGNLGAGKTFLVNSICAQWGIANVSSPTFALVNEYNGEKKVFHFDFYRIESEEELFDIGFDEYLADFDSVKFIEWPYLFPNILPKHCIKIEIKIISETERVIKINE